MIFWRSEPEQPSLNDRYHAIILASYEQYELRRIIQNAEVDFGIIESIADLDRKEAEREDAF